MSDNTAYENDDHVAHSGVNININVNEGPVVVNNKGNNTTRSDNHSIALRDGNVCLQTLNETDEGAEEENQKLRDKDPIFFCRWITSYPKSWFGEYNWLA